MQIREIEEAETPFWVEKIISFSDVSTMDEVVNQDDVQMYELANICNIFIAFYAFISLILIRFRKRKA